MRYYAGIGSRETPISILNKMTQLAKKLSFHYILRSGGAIGADIAFEVGADHKEIFKAKDATTTAMVIAERFHPNWAACSDYVRKLHTRNVMILLGKYLNSPVKFVVCWTPRGLITGGTGQGLRIAEAYDISVINFAIVPTVERVLSAIENLEV